MVQVQIMRSLYDLLFYGIKQNLHHLYSEPRTLDAIMEQHSAVFESIRRHDPDGASEAMRRHIAFVMDFFHERGAP
jgi:GntR family transcriptional repressor for pyruvate dehydrogenase complex